MLVGRRAESERIERLLADARAGTGAALTMRGEPGVGKTALLDMAASRATGMSVLRATGVAWEAEIAFSGALELLKPIVDLTVELPEPQRTALRGALALVPAEEVDRFAVCAATLRLLGAAASAKPLLLLIDDAQWLDSASLEALVFAARRIAGEPVGIVFAVREGAPSALDGAGFPQLVVEPLAPADISQLARARFGPAIAEAQVQRIHQVTGGYPLALVELERLGDAAAGLEAPLPVSGVVEQAYARDVERSDAAVRDLLLLAAADNTGDLAAILAAADTLGIDAETLEAAEASGLVTVADGRVTFRHPLMRSAVYQGAKGPRRRAMHAALATSLRGDWQADRRAWHRAAATLGPDESVAHELEETAQRTRARSGYAAAASALERAARLTPDVERRARRLVIAADALWHAGRGARTEELLSTALEQTTDALLRVEIQARRGRLAHFHGETGMARSLIMDASARAQERDAELALELAASAVLPALCCGDPDGARETFAMVTRLARHAGALTPDVSAGIGAALVACGELERATPYLQATIDAIGDPGRPSGDPQLLAYAADCLGWMGRYAEAGVVARHALERAREHGALAALAYAALHLTDYEIAVGDINAAVAAAGEANRISSETGQQLLCGWSALYLALIAANQGAAERTRAYLAEAEQLGVVLWFNGIDAVPWVRGRLHLAVGDSSAACESLEQAIASVAPHANWVPWTASADLIEAYIRTGRTEDAAAATSSLERTVQQPWAQAALARCQAMLAAGDSADDAFERSAAGFDRLGVPLEAARTRLCHGERLRRNGRRIEARVQLREALAAFERLRAESWAARASSELHLTGEVVGRRHGGRAIDDLTPQELQVALTVASGVTNKEAGARLFLSTKTIEAHLHRVYRKLGIRSRDELHPMLHAHTGPEPAEADRRVGA